MSTHYYALPNHSWWEVGFENDIPEKDKKFRIVLRAEDCVLIRRQSWAEMKAGPRYNYSEKFCGKDRPNETWKPGDLWHWGDTAIGILAQKAQDGSADAAEELARLARTATALLTRVCKANPKLVRPLARVGRTWPVNRKRNAKLSADEAALFDAIELGEDDFIALDPKAQWEFDDAGMIAYGLLRYVYSARNSNDGSYGHFGESAKKHLPAKFNKNTFDKWWQFAKEVFELSYPNPAAVEELNQLVKARSNRPPEASPSRFRDKIIEKIHDRFFAFTPRTKQNSKIHLCDCGNSAHRKVAGDWVCKRCDT